MTDYRFSGNNSGAFWTGGIDLTGVQRDFDTALLAAMAHTGRKIADRAAQLSPIEFGELRKSAIFVAEPAKKRVSIGFRQRYAAFVHEDPKAKHPNGQWKYLDAALFREVDIVRQTFVDHLRQELGL